MTKRRLTEAEQAFNAGRKELLASAEAEYVADAPFVFASRIGVATALSRIEFFKKILEIPGAIVEWGVYRGNSLMLFMHLSMILEPYAINRSIIGFDTFEGFAGIDGDKDPNDINETMFSDTNDGYIQKAIELNDLVRPVNRIPRCEIVKGDIAKTAPAYVEGRDDLVVAMLVLDTDLYESTKVALETFLPLMPKGAVVVFDEVAYKNFPGETAALKEVVGLQNIELRRLPFDPCVGYYVVS